MGQIEHDAHYEVCPRKSWTFCYNKRLCIRNSMNILLRGHNYTSRYHFVQIWSGSQSRLQSYVHLQGEGLVITEHVKIFIMNFI